MNRRTNSSNAHLDGLLWVLRCCKSRLGESEGGWWGTPNSAEVGVLKDTIIVGVTEYNVDLATQEVLVKATLPYDDVLARIKKTGKEVCFQPVYFPDKLTDIRSGQVWNHSAVKSH